MTGTIVVVSKVPKSGQSKTRLIPLLGEDGSVRLATAMLQDVVGTLNELSSCHKVLLYAPGTDDAQAEMRRLLGAQLLDGWTLLAMQSSNLTDSDLSHALTCVTKEILLRFATTTSLVLVGMDAPELPLEEVAAALSLESGCAMLCPAADGGYGLLGVSTTATSSSTPLQLSAGVLFQGVLWSHPLTALSQIKACQLAGYENIRLGRLMYDIDEEADVRQLCQRLQAPSSNSNYNVDGDYRCLSVSSCSTAIPQSGSCPNTRRALIDLGLL